MPGVMLAGALPRSFKLPPHLLAALVPLLVLFAALTIYRHSQRHRHRRHPHRRLRTLAWPHQPLRPHQPRRPAAGGWAPGGWSGCA